MPTTGMDEVSTEDVAIESLTRAVSVGKQGQEELRPQEVQQQQQQQTKPKQSKGSSDGKQDQEQVNKEIAVVEARIVVIIQNIDKFNQTIDETKEEVREIKSRIRIAEAAFAHLESVDTFLASKENVFLERVFSVNARSTRSNKAALTKFLVNEHGRLADEKRRLDDWKKSLDSATKRMHESEDERARLIEETWRGNDRHLSQAKDTFFSQVGSAKEDNDVLVFSAPIPLTKREKLYIRDAYKVIYDAAVTRDDAKKPKYSLVTGTPGIGKSAFLYYAFWRMVKAKQRVFFVKASMYFDGDRVQTLTASMMPSVDDSQFWTQDLWCLFDSADPTRAGIPVDECSILLATTPRRDIVKEFKKLVPTPAAFCMPLWSYEELESIAGWYPSNDWKRRFTDLGGIPRYVLEDVSESPEELLTLACSECEVKDATRMISMHSEVASITKVFRTLVHLHLKDPYTSAEARYASKAAIAMIADNHWKSCTEQRLELLDDARWNPLAAALCGYIRELHTKETVGKRRRV